MVKQQLFDYINQQIKKGVDKESLKKTLLSNGWASEDVEEALSSIALSPKMSSDINTGEVSQNVSPEVSPIATPSFANAGTLIIRAWNIYRSRFWTLIGISALLVLFAVLVNVFLTIISALGPIAAKLDQVLFLFFFIGLVLWSWLSLLFAIKDHAERIGVVESYRRGLSKTLTYLWIIILFGLILLGGGILFIIPAVLFAVWFFLSPYVLIDENLKGMNALMKSKEYVRGRWWDVLIRSFFVFTPMVIMFFVTMVYFMFFVASIIFSTGTSMYMGGGSTTLSVLPLLVMSVISLLLFLFWLTYTFSIYQSLKESRGESVFDQNKNKKKFIIVIVLGFGVFILGYGSAYNTHHKDVLRQNTAIDTAKEWTQENLQINQLNIEIIAYYKKNGALPQSLNNLVLSSKIRDGVSNKLFKYIIVKDGLYSVCLTQHPSEKYCVGNAESLAYTPIDAKFLPKYGGGKRTSEQLKADQELVDTTIKHNLGSRKTAYWSSFSSGRFYLYDGYIDRAIRLFNQAWLIDPQNPKAYLGMASVELARNNPASAKSLLLEGLSYNETNAQSQCSNLALTYIAQASSTQDKVMAVLYISQAKQETDKSLTDNPNDPICKKIQSSPRL